MRQIGTYFLSQHLKDIALRALVAQQCAQPVTQSLQRGLDSWSPPEQGLNSEIKAARFSSLKKESSSMEVESARNKTEKPPTEHPNSSGGAGVLRNRRKLRNISFAVIGVLVFIIILILILAFTVFKAKRPVTTVEDVSLRNLKFSVDLARLQVLLNATVDVDIAIKNPNKVGFKFKDSNAQLNYRGQQVGVVPIPAGKISADKTVPMNLTLTVMADRLISDSNFFSDVRSGELPLNTKTEIPGKVNVLNMFRIRVVSSSSCNFTVFLSNSSVGDQNCKYKTKF
ncbi:hypothetical protein V6N13_055045 [Hibiscus sabdariffa]